MSRTILDDSPQVSQKSVDYHRVLSQISPTIFPLSRTHRFKLPPRLTRAYSRPLFLAIVYLIPSSYVANLAVIRQLHKQVNEENAFSKSIIITQQNSAHFKEGIVCAIQST